MKNDEFDIAEIVKVGPKIVVQEMEPVVARVFLARSGSGVLFDEKIALARKAWTQA